MNPKIVLKPVLTPFSSTAFAPKGKGYNIVLLVDGFPRSGDRNHVVLAGGRDGGTPEQLAAQVEQIKAELDAAVEEARKQGGR